MEQRGLCAISGVKIDFHSGSKRTASLDRIDSRKGYIKNNLQWVHKRVNIMKHKMDDLEFIDWAHKISNFQYNHAESTPEGFES